MFMDLDSIPSLPKRSAEQFKRKRKFNQTKRSITSRDVSDPNDEEIGQKIDSIQLRKKEEGAEKIINQSIDEMKSESQEIPADFKYQDVKYENLDHTADVQFHTWGANLEEAISQMLLCMTAFQIDQSHVVVSPVIRKPLRITAESLTVLLFQTMDEAMNMFTDADLIFGYVNVEKVNHVGHEWVLEGYVLGEKYDQKKHGRGTEIKAITYSNMQIFQKGKLIDSSGAPEEEEHSNNQSSNQSNKQDPKHSVTPAMHGADIYAIVDI